MITSRTNTRACDVPRDYAMLTYMLDDIYRFNAVTCSFVNLSITMEVVFIFPWYNIEKLDFQMYLYLLYVRI